METLVTTQAEILRPPAAPEEVFAAVSTMMAGCSAAQPTGPFKVCTFNAEYGNAEKAGLYSASYKFMFERAHLVFLQEVDAGFAQNIAQSIGYQWWVSRANSRGQAVGFLAHPRAIVSGEPITYEEIADIDHVPDLRPAFQINLKDGAGHIELAAIVVHLKSLRPSSHWASRYVRYLQTLQLAKLLSDKPALIGGDWNCFLNEKESELGPLLKSGCRVVDIGNSQSTELYGGRLDGFIQKNILWKLQDFATFNFWQQLRGDFSDHGLVMMELEI